MINRKKANAVVVVLGLGVMTVAMIACKDEPPAVAPQPAYTGYAPSATAYPSGVPAATAPAAGGQMATPGPLALPCQADSACG